MSEIYYDADADPRVLDGCTVAVAGYGNQGRSQALNLRDSGVSVIIGNIDDDYRKQALADGFEVVAIADACVHAEIVLLLLPDEIMPEVYAADIRDHLEPGNLLCFASGYNIAFDLIAPSAEIDVVLIAPRMIGPGVRDTYLSGEGFPSFVGVHHDATGQAKPRMLALAHAMGSTRAGCITMSMHDEATLDLFTEQAFGPAFGNVLLAAVETLVGAGYPPEAVLLELILSGEFEYTFAKIREVGMLEQMEYHSHTSQYGSLTRGARFAELFGAMQSKMTEVLGEIRSGAFAAEWSGDRENKMKVLEDLKELRDQLPFADWERKARTAFRIGATTMRDEREEE
jgi:ketol-acid reductoisomerase